MIVGYIKVFDSVYYEKEHKKIFDAYHLKYQNRGSYLFEDGVVDISNYKGVLFLLKEAYSEKKEFGNSNLASDLAKNGPWGMWERVCEWVYGIENTTSERIEPFRPFSDNCYAFRHVPRHSAKFFVPSEALQYLPR